MAVEPTYNEVALPILRWCAERETRIGAISVGQLAQELNLDHLRVAAELDRLTEAAFLSGEFRKTGGGPELWLLSSARLAERGVRAIKMWPAEDRGQILVEALEAAAEVESDPVEKSGLRQAAEALGGVAQNIVTDITSSVVRSTLGLP